MSLWRKRQYASSLYIEHLQDRIRQSDGALVDAYFIIEELEVKLDKLEQDMGLLTTALRDLEIKLNSKASSNFVVM